MELAWPIPDQTELYHSKVCPFLYFCFASGRCTDAFVETSPSLFL